MPRTYALLPSEIITRSVCVPTIVGALSKPSGSITRGRLRKGSIAPAGMLGIMSFARASPRERGLSLTTPGAADAMPVALDEVAAPLGVVPAVVSGPGADVPGAPIVRRPRALSKRMTYPG